MGNIEARPGEALERGQRRRNFTVKGLLFAIGGVTGGYMGYTVASQGFDFSAPWSPTACLLMTAAYLIAMAWGSVALNKNIDDFERQNSYKAASFAGSVYVIVYPAWFLLWKGGFVVEPIHWALFVLFWVALAISMIYYRFR